MDKTINPYFKNPSTPYFASNEAEFFPVKTINILQYPCVSINLQNMKKLSSEMLKSTRPGKPDSEDASHIEGCVNPKIQEKYNITTKTSPVYYSYMLLHVTKNKEGKK